jgi:hypothetical protein
MPVPVRKLIGKLIRLNPGEWGALFQAQAALLAAQVMVWTRPQGRLVSRESTTATQVPTRPEDEARAEALARAVNRVARYGLVRPRCLVRAIGLRRLLASHGMEATVHIGVRQRDGTFDAHAWVRGTHRFLHRASGHPGRQEEVT